MIRYIIIVSILGISALLIAIVEHKQRGIRESRKLDEMLFRRDESEEET